MYIKRFKIKFLSKKRSTDGTSLQKKNSLAYRLKTRFQLNITEWRRNQSAATTANESHDVWTTCKKKRVVREHTEACDVYVC